jgi:hypothetical protein
MCSLAGRSHSPPLHLYRTGDGDFDRGAKKICVRITSLLADPSSGAARVRSKQKCPRRRFSFILADYAALARFPHEYLT